MDKSLKDLTIGFIGAGKVGFSLGKLFSEKGLHVTGYYNRHIEAAIEAADFTGSSYFSDLETLVNSCNVLFLTVSDGEISTVFQSIKDSNISGKIICHTSGALSSLDAFGDIDKTGAYGYSVHPLFPVSSKTNSYRELEDAFFCIEGSAEYLDLITELLNSANIKTKIISSDKKVQYHAACAISSNLICGLINESISLMKQCGFDEDEAINALSPLIRSNVNHVIEDGLVNALTGPVERNDLTTVQKHIACFDSEEEKYLYKAVSRQVLDIAKRKHGDRDYTFMENELN